MRRFGPVLLGLAALAGCAGAPPARPVAPSVATPAVVPQAPVTGRAPLGEQAAALARTFVGTPYRYGGRAPAGFDCSGLVWYVYQTLGVPVPRTAAEQRVAAQIVPRDALQPGDLVFFYTPVDHVGIYLGDGEFVHAPAAGKRVERVRLDSPYFILGFAGGGRLSPP
jgi:cell wall-associated NlpC family hydrolase